jgi:adenine deaminase
MKNQTLLFLIIIIATLMLTNFPTGADDPELASDLIIINATVHTMDPNRPAAEAVAIKDNRIVGVGSGKEIRKMARPHTGVIDAGKKVVLPGFNAAATRRGSAATD